MAHTKKIKTLITAIIISLAHHSAKAHTPTPQDDNDDNRPRPELGADYTTELQTDFSNVKWVNLLHLHANLPLSKRLALNIGTISLATTDEDPLIPDLQGYSNIEFLNQPFALAVACLEWAITPRHTLCAGIRRIDEDYFCSEPLTLFTNSSSGAFPTISLNHDISLYPYAAMGIHYRYDSPRLTINTSIYNGTGNNEFSGRYNIFRFCPRSDGIFTLAQIEYHHRNAHYYLGAAAHYGEGLLYDSERLRISIWAYTEQALTPRLTLIAAYSHAFSPDALCRNFAAAGIRYDLPRIQAGIFTDYSRILDLDEFATEFTLRIPLNTTISLQPTIHLVTTDRETNCIGMMRMNVTL